MKVRVCRGILLMSLPFALTTVALAADKEVQPVEWQRRNIDVPLYRTVRPTPLWSAPPLTVRFTNAANRQTLKFPAAAADDERVVVLKFRVRHPIKGCGGWSNILAVRLNGQAMKDRTAAGVYRLLNRQGEAVSTSDSRYPSVSYFSPFNGQSCLLVPFSDRWDRVDPRFTSDREDLYTYLLNISDLVRGDRENQLELVNLGNAGAAKPYPADQGILIADLEVGYLPRSVYNQLADDAVSTLKEFTAAGSVSRGGLEIQVAAKGGVRFQYAGERYYWRSTLSEPGDHIRYHDLSWSAKVHPAPVTVAADEKAASISIRLKAAAYTLDRTLKVDGPFVRVTDTYLNTSPDVVGILLKNEFFSENPADRWYIGGKREKAVEDDWGAINNPTVYFCQKASGMGAAIKDTVLRMQLENTGSSRMMSMANRHFGLAAGASYTAQWQIYLGPAGYFNFINTVRRDWNVNYTIPGLWSFMDFTREDFHAGLLKDPEKFKAFVTRYNIDIMALCPWFEYYYLPKYWQPRSRYKELIGQYTRAVKRVDPNIKCLADLESFLYWAPLEMFKGTVKPFPPNTGNWSNFNTVTSKETTAIIDATPWKDSVLRTPDGRVLIDRDYARHYADTAVNLEVFPAEGNYWHKKFMGILDYVLNDCGLDGVYIDGFTQFYSWRLYDRWDGHSVDINPRTGKVDRRYGNGGLLSAKPRAEWARYCQSHGKLMFTNGYADTAELQSLPVLGFCEAEYSFDPSLPPYHNAERAGSAQLSSPLALGIRVRRYDEGSKDKPHAAKLVQRAVINYLRYGVLYCHYYTRLPEKGQYGYGECGAINYMFPFTPVELGEGFTIGKERIVTCVSRTFHWPGSVKPIVKRFDDTGVEIPSGFEISQSPEGGWRVAVKLDDWKQTAVIMGEGK